MKSILVKEMMVPIADYATVDEDATLYEVVLALEGAQQKKVPPEEDFLTRKNGVVSIL